MNKDFFVKQLEDIIIDYDLIKSKAKYEDLSGNISVEEITTVLTKAKAAIERIVGVNSEYFKDTDAVFKDSRLHNGLRLKSIISFKK